MIKKNKNRVPKELSSILDLFGRTQIKPSYFVIPIFCSFAAALLEGASLALISPLGQGILEKDFEFLTTKPHYGFIAKWLWELTIRPNTLIFILLLGGIFSSAILKNCFEYFSQLSLARMNQGFSCRLKQIVFGRYLDFGKQYFDRNNSDYLRTVLHTFIGNATEGLSNFHSFLNAFFMLAVYFCIMLFMSWPMAIFSLLLFPIYHQALTWLIKKIRNTAQVETQKTNELNIQIGNILSGMPLVKAYSREEQEKVRFNRLSNAYAQIQFSMTKKQSLMHPLQEIITLIFSIILIGFVSLLFIRGGNESITTFVVYFIVLRRTSGYIAALNRFRGVLARLSAPLAEIQKALSDTDKAFIQEGPKIFDGLKKGIEFRDLSFSYLKEIQVLNHLSFQIEKGKVTAIVGQTGAGKTTLINLLMRYYDCPSASIFLDGTDIREFTLKSIRKHIALVSQDCILFDDTIQGNMAYGLDSIPTQKELLAVAEKARLGDLIDRLPEGLNTRIGERGVKLSGGEKQRLSIARAMLKGAQILILDEATSSLDSKTEHLIQEAIDEAVQGRTAIVIAHRLATIKNADKIVVLEKGKVLEEGSLKELLALKGRFYEFWEEQKFY